MRQKILTASLLNAYSPRCDVNFATPTGYTALHFAVGQEDRMISKALLRRGADAGCWVVFRNAHLASEAWLLGLEKALRGLRPAPGFRVVLTAEVAVGEPSRLPGRLVARAAVVALGADVGLRAALLRHEALLTQRDAEKGGAAWDRGPIERRRVHALLAVAHAVVT